MIHSTSATDRRRRLLVHPTALAVLAVGAVLTVVLVLATSTAHNGNEDRLLRERTRQAAAVLTAAVPGIETPLVAAVAEVVDVTDGADQDAFRRLMAPLVEASGPYVSASLWRLDGVDLEPLVVVGLAPVLASQQPDVIRALLQRSAATTELVVTGLLDGAKPRLGYSKSSAQAPVGFVVYAEAPLPVDRTTAVPPDSAFSGLAHAVYLGETEDPSGLLTASTPDIPLGGRRATERVAFGDTALLLVMSPTEELGGRLLAVLSWIVGAVGLSFTFGSAALTEWLQRRRDHADRLAEENTRLYLDQRSVAQTLQHSLLPERLPDIAGVDLAVRYLPGVAGVDIGGDWYDAIPMDDGCLLIVVGDVSGRGLKAGTVMASLRYAIRAFASQGDAPSTILTKLNNLADFGNDGTFATVFCAAVDVAGHTLSVANAGHPHPLLIDGATVAFVDTQVGVPIGATAGAVYETVIVPIPPGATVLAFTDGLFERRGETIDDGLERLRRTACGPHDSLEGLLTRIVEVQSCGDAHDDTAILGIRWTNE